MMTTVVVVEDETLVRIEVLTADNADQAIEILESWNDITTIFTDTIFTDIEMLGSMNRLKLAAAIRDRWPPVNMVITSGKARPIPGSPATAGKRGRYANPEALNATSRAAPEALSGNASRNAATG
jgi:two-component system, response regulator PdtaR